MKTEKTLESTAGAGKPVPAFTDYNESLLPHSIQYGAELLEMGPMMVLVGNPK